MRLSLSWIKCSASAGNAWCDLLKVNLDHEHFDNLEGVYIIWHSGQNPATVRVGQGTIRDRLSAHRQDQAILAYRNQGLSVTWSTVAPPYRDGVERFLGENLSPKVGDRFPDAQPVEVNYPW